MQIPMPANRAHRYNKVERERAEHAEIIEWNKEVAEQR